MQSNFSSPASESFSQQFSDITLSQVAKASLFGRAMCKLGIGKAEKVKTRCPREVCFGVGWKW
jgi:hypothetical protein